MWMKTDARCGGCPNGKWCVIVWTWTLSLLVQLLGNSCHGRVRKSIWLILPVVICLSQRLSHASIKCWMKCHQGDCERLAITVVIYRAIINFRANGKRQSVKNGKPFINSLEEQVNAHSATFENVHLWSSSWYIRGLKATIISDVRWTSVLSMFWRG